MVMPPRAKYSAERPDKSTAACTPRVPTAAEAGKPSVSGSRPSPILIEAAILYKSLRICTSGENGAPSAQHPAERPDAESQHAFVAAQ